MTTREDIERALVEWESWGTWDGKTKTRMLAEAARRGRVLFPSICQTCGGDGLMWPGRRVICPSCGGSGKQWPREVVFVLMDFDVSSWTAVKILDRLAALAEEEE